VEAFALGVLPVYCKAFSENPAVLGVANTFSGGIFMSIAFMHIMPEQVESWEEYQKAHGGGEFPLPFLIVISGYALMLVLDRILFDAHVGGHDDDHVCGEHIPINVEKMSLVQVVRASLAS